MRVVGIYITDHPLGTVGEDIDISQLIVPCAGLRNSRVLTTHHPQ